MEEYAARRERILLFDPYYDPKTVGLKTVDDIVWHRAATLLTDPRNSTEYPRTQARLRWPWDFDETT